MNRTFNDYLAAFGCLKTSLSTIGIELIKCLFIADSTNDYPTAVRWSCYQTYVFNMSY